MVPNRYSFSLKKAPSGRLFYYQTLGSFALVLALVSWLNPNHYPPWVVFENDAAAFAAVLLAALALVVRGRKIVAAPTYIACAILTALVVVAQVSVGMVSPQGLGLAALYLSAFSLSIVVGYGLYGGMKADVNPFEKMALATVLLGSIISACVVLGQLFQIESYYPLLMSEHGGMRPFGNLGQPNNQATLLLTGVLCVELLLRKNAISTLVACLCMLALLPAIAATESRTAILSALAAAAFLLMVGRKRKYEFTLGWLLALLVCFVMVPELGDAVSPDNTRFSGNLTDSPRLHIYTQLMWAISEKPWTGYGWMQTAYAQSLAAAHVFGGVEADYAHNVVIDYLVWFGIPLGSLVLLSFGLALVKNWRKSQINYQLAYVLFIPFAVHSMLELPFAYAFFLLPAGLLLGYLGGHVVARDARVASRLTIGWQVLAPWTILTAGLATLVCVDYLELAEDFRVLRAENRNVGRVPDGFRQSSPVVLTDMRFMMDMIRYKPRPGENPETIEQIRHFVLHAHSPSAHVKLISVQFLNQHFAGAAVEIYRFKNLYGQEIVSWGIGSLRDAYCEDPKSQHDNLSACCALSDISQCRLSSKPEKDMLRAD